MNPLPLAKRPNGACLYRGPSMLDGAPIIVIVTGLSRPSTNPKTGDVLQTWILRDDVDPQTAARDGSDVSICGGCSMRPFLRQPGERACYVAIRNAPRNIWSSFHRGIYGDAVDLDAVRAIGRGRKVRLGSYGDPAAVPVAVWQALTADAVSHMGYTHQWRTAPQAFAALAMASADSAAEGVEARAMGWRTFRVRDRDDAVERGEVVCPASAEAGFKTDCASCRACGGTSAKARASMVIVDHGPSAKRAPRFTLTTSRVAA